jgi:Concanavalin A-like lectin/glucanases superfamily
VTTDSQSQAVFDVPFTPPAGLSVVTATATAPEGNTSEVSAARRPTLQAPTQILRDVPGQPLIFSAASGDGIALQDPDAGPLDPARDLTLSVAGGTLTLSSLSGLVGSGNGTGTLQYQGPLSALNAVLDGLSYTQAAGSHGNFTVSLNADSEGAPALQAQVNITDGFFSVTTTADSGPGSLRQAILDSNVETGGANTIDFAIPGQGVQTIAPLSPLPAITNPVLIDGFSQPGYAGTPLIELSGSQAGATSGLTITGSDVTVCGLDINDFYSGAGILISGTAATGNTIEANDIGTDPTGLQRAANRFGVQIQDCASDNLVGGTSAAAGNLIAFNIGQGVVVQGNSTTSNQITANRIFANDNLGDLQFDGMSYVSLPDGLLDGLGNEETIEAWFKTTSGGVILGYQGSPADSPGQPAAGVPILYVGTDGMLHASFPIASLLVSDVVVNDGAWHSVALVLDGGSDMESLYLDGQLVASGFAYSYDYGYSFDQIGTGYSAYYPAAPAGWYGFQAG